MKNYIDKFLLLILGVALVACTASAQINRHPLLPAGGAVHNLQQSSAQNQADSKQSEYTWLELDPNHTGVGYCYADAFAINNSDQVVVNWVEGENCEIYHASLWDHGNWSSLDYPFDKNCRGQQTYLTSLTDSGFAFGFWWSECDYYYQPAAGINVKNKRWSSLPDIPDLAYSEEFSMSDNGLAVGVAGDVNWFITKHWIWDGRNYSYPVFPDGWDVSLWWSGPISINNKGQSAGQYIDTATGRLKGYLQDGTQFTAFDAPPWPSPPAATFVTEVGNSGYVVFAGRYGDDPLLAAH